MLNIGSLAIGPALVGTISDMFSGRPDGIFHSVTTVAVGASIRALIASRRALTRFRLAIERTDGEPEA